MQRESAKAGAHLLEMPLYKDVLRQRCGGQVFAEVMPALELSKIVPAGTALSTVPAGR